MNKKLKTEGGLIVRSGLEKKVAEQLEDLELEFEYESGNCKFVWYEHFPRAECAECGSGEVYQKRSYLADFYLPPSTIIEVKGRLTTRDRKVLLGVKEANPRIDLRVVFDKNNRISRGAKSRCSDWAEQVGFEYGIRGIVPEEWVEEWLEE